MALMDIMETFEGRGTRKSGNSCALYRWVRMQRVPVWGLNSSFRSRRWMFKDELHNAHTHTFLWTLQLFFLMHMKLTVPPEFNLLNCDECKWRDLLEPLTGFFWSTKDMQVGLNPRPVSLLPLLPSASSLNSAPCYQSYPHSSFPLASLNPHTLHHLQCPSLVNAVVPLRYHSMLWES